MDYQNIEMVEARPAMSYTPGLDDATGAALEGQVTELSLKDRAEPWTQEEVEDPLFEEHYAELREQMQGDDETYSLEQIEEMFESGAIDEPSQELAQASWNLELPSEEEVPGIDVVQILATKFLMGSMTQEEAINEAFAHNLSPDQLARAYSVYNRAYNQALGR